MRAMSSQPLDNATKAGAGQTIGLILAGLTLMGGGFLLAQGGWSQGEASTGHVVVGWGEGQSAPAGAVVLHATARVSDATAAAFGVGPAPSDAGFAYFRCDVVAVPMDGGADPGPNFIPGSTIVYDDDQVDAPPPAGSPQFECWRQGRFDAPFKCACALLDAGCLQPDGGAAPMGVTLQPGAFVPSWACAPKACVELAGSSSWIPECGP